MTIKVENKFERKNLGDRIKETLSLSLFTLIMALVSVALMDIVVYPLVSFAVQDVNLFNILFENIFLLFILSFLTYTLSCKIIKLNKENTDKKQILLYLIKRPIHYISLILFIFILSSAIIFILYVFFSQNYYYLYKISTGL